MLSFLPSFVRGILAALLLALNTLICCVPLFTLTLIKLLLPSEALRRAMTPAVNFIHEGWISCNKGWMALVRRTRWNVEGLDGLDYQHSYLVTSNHQSWVDILVLQHQLNRRIRPMKFFLKQELIWVPVIGACWWALDFPFMKRYSKAYLAKHPEKKGKDLQTTRRTCAKFRHTPVGVFNFLEGTRFTRAKHDEQGSPFRYLLKPKAGGIAFVLDAMGEQLESIVNVTIHYPEGIPDFWTLLSGQIGEVVVRLQELKIPAAFIGKSYDQDATYRLEFQQWVNALWEEKDEELGRLHQQFAPATR
ncbi:acyltransferase [Pseudomonas kuykendallii]|uniref:1-acyl-sn-glycerol-3-phosphate acyltransferase n=1 Tax=Pseudomonas kuykendallii TaxID=1007099 RepID=A0A1H2XB01_9PSED|nr:acyltransferase [Pseudomonas kuykendallii]MCQ4273195.1 acyltransferase [Pseudomonas kuykendallii]SDW89987.1 1-acyl-sn-glycerol-3-phosphate acyltransferase [Pseudomonas kuykendallii]